MFISKYVQEFSKPKEFDRICQALTAVNLKIRKEINEAKQLSRDVFMYVFGHQPPWLADEKYLQIL